jgi:hypothetical protein
MTCRIGRCARAAYHEWRSVEPDFELCIHEDWGFFVGFVAFVGHNLLLHFLLQFGKLSRAEMALVAMSCTCCRFFST